MQHIKLQISVFFEVKKKEKEISHLKNWLKNKNWS